MTWLAAIAELALHVKSMYRDAKLQLSCQHDFWNTILERERDYNALASQQVYHVSVAWKCNMCKTAVHKTYLITGRNLPHQQQLASILQLAT